ncbi:hypothetical protein SB759_18140 [Pseudomonas sp. SIMBA_059]
MARAQQDLDDCGECDIESLQRQRDERRRQLEFDAAGTDENKPQIQY